MTIVNEFNFQISEQGVVSSIASDGVPAALLDHVKTAVDRIQKSPLPLHREFYQNLIKNKSFSIVNGGRSNKQVPVKPDGTLALKEVLTVSIQIKKIGTCPIDCSDPTKMKKIEECFKKQASPTEATPLKTKVVTPKKGPSGLGAFFERFIRFFGSCTGRAPKKIKRQVVPVVTSTPESLPEAQKKSTREVPNKPLPSTPARAPSTPMAIRGITNEGNTCFINAVFQMIMNDEALTAAILETYLDEVQKPGPYQEGYRCFINAVMDYREGQPVSLENLRVLLRNTSSQSEDASDISLQPGQIGDGSEILLALLRPLNQDKYPHLFVALGTARKWARFTPPEDKAQDSQRVFERRSQSKEGLSVMPPNGEIPAQYDSKDDSKGLIIPLQIPNSPIAGQTLLDQSFNFHAVPVGEETAYKDGWYQPVAEKLSLERAPERCIIQLKRFKSDGSKVNTRVDMPENLTLQGQNYRLKSVAVHINAPLHYYSLIRKESGWFVANDSMVSSAQAGELNYALSQGYLYFYERV